MLSISKPQTNLIYLSILVGRLDLTRFSIKTNIGSGILLTEICLLNPHTLTLPFIYVKEVVSHKATYLQSFRYFYLLVHLPVVV